MKNVKKIVFYSNGSDVMKNNDVTRNPGFKFFIQKNGTVQGGTKIGSQTEIVKICLHGCKEFSNDQFRRLAVLVRKLAKVARLKKGFLVPATKNFDVGKFVKNYLPEFAKEGIGTFGITKPAARSKKGSKEVKGSEKITGSVEVKTESKEGSEETK